MWPHRAEDVHDEPVVPWERKNYKGTKADPATSPRNFGEMETDRDLDKPIEQLLSDVHEGLGEWRKFAAKQPPLATRPALSAEAFTATNLVLYSLGRTASMQAVVARENLKTQQAIQKLTTQLLWFTIGLFVLTVIMCSLAGVSVFLDLGSPMSEAGAAPNRVPDAASPDSARDGNIREGGNTPPGEKAPPQSPVAPSGASLQSLHRVHTFGENLLSMR